MHSFCGARAPGEQGEDCHGQLRVCTKCQGKAKKAKDAEPTNTAKLKAMLEDKPTEPDRSVSNKHPAKKSKPSDTDRSVSAKQAAEKSKPSDTDRSLSAKQPAKKNKTSDADRSVVLAKSAKKGSGKTSLKLDEFEDRVNGSSLKIGDRVLVLWQRSTKSQPAEVHQAQVTGVIPPQGWTSGAKKRKRQKFHYTLSYKDGDTSGRAGPDHYWESDSLDLYPWSDDDLSTDEDMPHKWISNSK